MNSRFEFSIIEAINNAIKTVKASPLMLGSTASGYGGPTGGYVGYLTQGRVSYDTFEVASSGTPLSGMSLIDNLNHIRYRLGVIESGAVAPMVIRDDGVFVSSGISVLDFVGSGISAVETSSGYVTITVSAVAGSGGGASTFLDLTDTPSSYTGNAGKAVIVNGTEDALIFSSVVSGVSDTSSIDLTLTGGVISADVKVDGITDLMIDWGTGANQVSMDDIPSGVTYGKLTIADITDLTDGGITSLHTHTPDHAAVTVLDSSSIDFTLTGQQITASAIFGTTGDTVASGNHLHTGVYEPIDATIVRTGQTNWIDLTDGGVTTLHSHSSSGITQNYLITEDLSSQITGSGYHFDLTWVALARCHVYGNIRQTPSGVVMDSDMQGFTLSYAPTLSDSIIVDYYPSDPNKFIYDDAGNLVIDDAGDFVLEE